MMGSLTYNWPLTKYNQMRMVITICLLEQVRFFPNSLTGAFTCYLTLPIMSIFTWNEMERDFNTLFFRAEPTEGFGRWVEKRRHGNELLITSSRKRLCLCFISLVCWFRSRKILSCFCFRIWLGYGCFSFFFPSFCCKRSRCKVYFFPLMLWRSLALPVYLFFCLSAIFKNAFCQYGYSLLVSLSQTW